MKKTKNRTRKDRGGMSGIGVKGKHRVAANSFIKHSTIEYLAKGSNGFTFVATLNNDGIPNSPYTSTDAETFSQPVNKILLKLIFLNKPKVKKSDHIIFTYKEEKGDEKEDENEDENEDEKEDENEDEDEDEKKKKKEIQLIL